MWILVLVIMALNTDVLTEGQSDIFKMEKQRIVLDTPLRHKLVTYNDEAECKSEAKRIKIAMDVAYPLEVDDIKFECELEGI